MLYRIDRIDNETDDKSYEYVCGKRALGKWSYEIVAHDNMRIENIVQIPFSWNAFWVCANHTISSKPNRTVEPRYHRTWFGRRRAQHL